MTWRGLLFDEKYLRYLLGLSRKFRPYFNLFRLFRPSFELLLRKQQERKLTYTAFSRQKFPSHVHVCYLRASMSMDEK